MDSALNITLDTTKDDLAVEIAGIITKLDEDCTAVPCSFTADIKTAADELLDANWTSLHAMKNAENVTHVLETVFLAFGRKICFAIRDTFKFYLTCRISTTYANPQYKFHYQ